MQRHISSLGNYQGQGLLCGFVCVYVGGWVYLVKNLKLNFQFELSYDRFVNLHFPSREETEIKILKWFAAKLEMIQHYRTHYTM